MENEIEIGVTTITNVIEVTAQPNDQIVDIGVTDNTDEVVINVTPSVIEININKGGLNSNLVTSVNTKIGDVVLDKNDIGLGNVDNTADYDKMISLDTQIALNNKADLVDGVVPSYQLPSYVDDVLEVANYAALPLAGEIGKIYVTLDNNKIYRWSGSIYIEIASNNAIWGAITGTLSNQTDLQNALNAKVPYTGATSDVNLGEFGIQLGNLEFDLTPTNAPTTVGSLSWNDSAGTLDLKLKGGNTTLQIGQETVARIVNKTATNITLLEANYQAVRVTGAQGQRPKVDLAQANNDLNSTTTLGLVTETILINEEGFITTSGQVQQINTTGLLQGETWADGDILYLSGTIAGQITNIKPIAPIHTVIIGFVEYAHANNGKIFVKVDNGYELEELHNVSAIAPNNNEVLAYDSATTLWKPKTVITALGYTPANDSNVVHLTGNETISGEKTLNNSLLIFKNLDNADTSRISVTTSGFFFNIDAVGGDNDYVLGKGFLSMAKQKSPLIASTISNSLLTTSRLYQLPNAAGTFALTSDLSSYVPTSRTLTINGVTQDLSANRTFTIPVGISGSGTIGKIPLFTGTTAIGNSSITEFDGYLGVTKPMSIGYSIATTGNALTLGLTNAGSTGNVLYLYNEGTGDLINAQSPAGFVFKINGSGNVGIGTGTIGSKLQVNGNAAIGYNTSTNAQTNGLAVSGNVTIGSIASIVAKLEVTSTVNFIPAANFICSNNSVPMSMTNNSNSISTMGFKGSTSPNEYNVRLGVDGADLVFYTNNTEKIRILSNGSAGIGTTSVLASAQLQINSTTKGFLPPRMTTTQKNAIASPAAGLMVYDTTTNKACCYNGTIWNDLF